MPIKVELCPILYALDLPTPISPFRYSPLLTFIRTARLHTRLRPTRRYLLRVMAHSQLPQGIRVSCSELEALVGELVDLPVHAIALVVLGAEVEVPVAVVEERGGPVYAPFGYP